MSKKVITTLRHARVYTLCISMFVLGLVGCGVEIDAPTPTEALDGKTIFRGIALGEGEVASLFPEIWSDYSKQLEALPSEDLAEVKKVNDQWVTAIDELDSSFFEEFGKNMQSGNQLTVEASLNKMSDLMVEATDEGLVDLKTDAEGISTQQVVGPALTVVAAVGVAVVAFAAVFFYSADDGTEETRLQRDKWINLIAVRLAAN